MSPSYRIANGGGVSSRNLIEHRVSKMDTLAGVAIKYGVEVSDLKRLNGLATDLQMFALKTLLIPSPGRHPPSATSSPSQNGSTSSNDNGNTSEKGIQNKLKFNFLESLEMSRLEPNPQRVSSSLNKLRDLNGFATKNGPTEGTEMAVYRAEIPDYLTEGVQQNESPDGEKSNEKSVRRRQKTEGDSTLENGVTNESTSATGKRLSMRAKSASKSSLLSEAEEPWLNSFPVGLGDSIFTDGLHSVRKSSSSPSFLDQDRTSSVWTTPKWNLKQDLQSLSTAAISIPIFDGLPKPISGRKSKAALD